DERSAWELFAEADGVREAVTRKVYEAGPTKPGELEEPKAIQAFIDAEHAETTYHPRYCGGYENRYVRPGDLAELCCRAAVEEFDDPQRLAAAHAGLYGGELKERMEVHQSRHKEANRLAGLARGAVALTGKDFEHRGSRYGLTDA